ncbi:hypothetical protein [Nocardia fluminea]|uniref:hypothetical protein n=1 Tax=Nocardia fluminea TaxID=134984 RepID=UPI003D1470D0
MRDRERAGDRGAFAERERDRNGPADLFETLGLVVVEQHDAAVSAAMVAIGLLAQVEREDRQPVVVRFSTSSPEC